MREIKFRGFSKESKYWIFGSYLYTNYLSELSIKGYFEEHLICNCPLGTLYKEEIYPESLGQYTGIQDKNGNGIYEGDILHCHEYDKDYSNSGIVQTFKNAVVGFANGSFYYYPNGNMKQPHQLLMYAYKPEVIGSIYQNPELCS